MKIGNENININRFIAVGKPLGPAKEIGNFPKDQKANSFEKPIEPEFRDVLKSTIERNSDIRISKHAKQRMLDRRIQLSDSQLKNMEIALGKARNKGVKDSLILMDNTAFIVNVPSGTIITAVDGKNLSENVFTNIDGAIII